MSFHKKSVLTLAVTFQILAGYGSVAGQEPKLRDTLFGNTGIVTTGIFSPDGHQLPIGSATDFERRHALSRTTELSDLPVKLEGISA